MKKIIVLIFICLISSFSVSAQDGVDHLVCLLKISDNKINCPGFFFRECPLEILKESNHRIVVQAHEGEEKTEMINFKMLDGDSKRKTEKEKDVILFKNDFRAEKLKTIKQVKINLSDIASYLKISFLKEGEKVAIPIEVSAETKSKINLELPRDEKKPQIIILDKTQILITCEKVNKRIFGDLSAEKEALKKYGEKFQNASVVKPE